MSEIVSRKSDPQPLKSKHKDSQCTVIKLRLDLKFICGRPMIAVQFPNWENKQTTMERLKKKGLCLLVPRPANIAEQSRVKFPCVSPTKQQIGREGGRDGEANGDRSLQVLRCRRVTAMRGDKGPFEAIPPWSGWKGLSVLVFIRAIATSDERTVRALLSETRHLEGPYQLSCTDPTALLGSRTRLSEGKGWAGSRWPSATG